METEMETEVETAGISRASMHPCGEVQNAHVWFVMKERKCRTWLAIFSRGDRYSGKCEFLEPRHETRTVDLQLPYASQGHTVS